MAINIGTVKSIGKTEGLQIIPDDRQELVKTVTSTGASSVAVDDAGYVSDGNVISLNAVFSDTDFTVLSGYWTARTKVTVVLDDGTTIYNARIVIKGYQYYNDLINNYKLVNLEIWKV